MSDTVDTEKGDFGFQTTVASKETNEFDSSFAALIGQKYAEHVISTNDEFPIYLEVRPEGTHPWWNLGKRVVDLPGYEKQLKNRFFKDLNRARRAMFLMDRFIGQLIPKLTELKLTKVERKLEPNQTKVEPKQTKVEPKQTKVEPKQTKAEPKQTKVEPKQTKAEPKQTKAEPKQAKAEPKSHSKGTDRRPTLVVISSDHGYGIELYHQTRRETQFRIPFVIADLTDVKDSGRGVVDPTDWGKVINDTTASNMDIWPTIFDVLGVREFEHTGLGRSLMRPSPETTYTFSEYFDRYHIVRQWKPKRGTDYDTTDARHYDFRKWSFAAKEGGKINVVINDLLKDPMETTREKMSELERELPTEVLQMKKLFEAVMNIAK